MQIKLLLLALAINCPSFDMHAQVTFDWVEKASLPAAGRWGAFYFEIGGFGYIAGGNAGGAYMSDVWRYDPISDAWAQVASMPQGRSHGTSWSINGKGYVACGHLGGSYYSNSLWEYDPVLDQWATRAPLPSDARYGSHGFAINGHGYVGGGNIGSAEGPFLADMWKYDPEMDQWTMVNSIPDQARYGSTGFVIGSRAYVHGGRDAGLDFSNELWEYDPATEEWNMVETMPGPGRSWMMVMPFGNDAVVAGGAENGVITYDAFRYFPENDQWTEIPEYPGESGWSGISFTISGRVFGGLGRRIYPSNGHHSDLWELVKVDPSNIGGFSLENASGLAVYPNPVNAGRSITMDLDLHELSGKGIVQIVDAIGKVVQEQRLKGAMLEIQVAAGAYSLIVLNEERSPVARARLVVQ